MSAAESVKIIINKDEPRKRRNPDTATTEDSTPKKHRKLPGQAELLSPPSVPQATICTCQNSNNVVSLILKFPSGAQSIPFTPKFTHQIFENERLCVKPASRAEICYTALSLDCRYNFIEGQNDKTSSNDLLECPQNHCRKEDIMKKLTAGEVFPSAPIAQLSDFKAASTTPINLPGKVVYRFEQAVKDSVSGNYAIRRMTMTDPSSRAFFDRLQRFSLMFIDGAELVDLTDHRWSALVAFQTNSTGDETSVVGYTTLFSFWNPTRTTQPRTVRVCQALVLPPFQKRGIGSRMLELVNKDAEADAEVLEVNIEDPCPGFQHMRDVLDISRCMDREVILMADVSSDIIRSKLKVSPRQAVRCFEILKLSSVNKKDSDQYKSYRLLVKKRLYRENIYYLKTKKSDQMKLWLANSYSTLEQRYEAVLSSVAKKRATVQLTGANECP